MTHIKNMKSKRGWISTYPDDEYYEITNIIRVIPTNSGTWYLYSETYFDEDFVKFEDEILSIMESFTLPDSELILNNNDSLISPSDAPSEWIVGDENMQIEGYVFPISFYNPNYSGLTNPMIMMLHTQTDEDILSENYSKKGFLEGFRQGFLEGFTEDGSIAKTTFENFEKFNRYGKVTLRIEAANLLEGVPFLQNFEVISWIFENGEVFILFFASDVEDFNENFPEFRRTVNSEI